jgi:hypothetical protein
LESVAVGFFKSGANNPIRNGMWANVVVAGAVLVPPLGVAAVPWPRIAAGLLAGLAVIPFAVFPELIASCYMFGDCLLTQAVVRGG